MGVARLEALESYRITSLPSEMYYVCDFFAREEETTVLQKIPANRWISLSHRCLQSIPSPLTANNTLIGAPLPEYLTRPVFDRFEKLRVFEGSPHDLANHCLVNEYKAGEGIMPHEDGAAYHPVVATVSLGSTLVLDVSEKAASEHAPGKQKTWRILQEPGSLLVTTGSAYTDTLHGIANVAVDEDLNERTVANWNLLRDPERIQQAGGRNERDLRISLTYRDVKKVSRVGAKLFGSGCR